MIRKLNQIKWYLIGGTKANKGKEVIEEHFRELGTFKSAGPDYLHPRVLKELANVIARPPAFILEKEGWTGEGPDKWNQQMEYLLFFFLNREKHNHSNYRLFSLSWIPGKIQEQIIKQSICNHLEEHKVLGSNQRDFVKYKLCQTNLILSMRN